MKPLSRQDARQGAEGGMMLIDCPDCAGVGLTSCCGDPDDLRACLECEGTGEVHPECAGCSHPIEGAAFIVDETEIYHSPGCVHLSHPSVRDPGPFDSSRDCGADAKEIE